MSFEPGITSTALNDHTPAALVPPPDLPPINENAQKFNLISITRSLGFVNQPGKPAVMYPHSARLADICLGYLSREILAFEQTNTQVGHAHAYYLMKAVCHYAMVFGSRLDVDPAASRGEVWENERPTKKNANWVLNYRDGKSAYLLDLVDAPIQDDHTSVNSFSNLWDAKFTEQKVPRNANINKKNPVVILSIWRERMLETIPARFLDDTMPLSVEEWTYAMLVHYQYYYNNYIATFFGYDKVVKQNINSIIQNSLFIKDVIRIRKIFDELAPLSTSYVNFVASGPQPSPLLYVLEHVKVSFQKEIKHFQLSENASVWMKDALIELIELVYTDKVVLPSAQTLTKKLMSYFAIDILPDSYTSLVQTLDFLLSSFIEKKNQRIFRGNS